MISKSLLSATEDLQNQGVDAVDDRLGPREWVEVLLGIVDDVLEYSGQSCVHLSNHELDEVDGEASVVRNDEIIDDNSPVSVVVLDVHHEKVVHDDPDNVRDHLDYLPDHDLGRRAPQELDVVVEFEALEPEELGDHQLAQVGEQQDLEEALDVVPKDQHVLLD